MIEHWKDMMDYSYAVPLEHRGEFVFGFIAMSAIIVITLCVTLYYIKDRLFELIERVHRTHVQRRVDRTKYQAKIAESNRESKLLGLESIRKERDFLRQHLSK